ncbi:dynein regulatory complex subunit 3-like [Oryctolagus cuniculus]|uniref:dynein regulatory complex subunit 3-like n=1 Tax=Oryctolagus cuniculus TaxID=9986 RepID=UPI0038798192
MAPSHHQPAGTLLSSQWPNWRSRAGTPCHLLFSGQKELAEAKHQYSTDELKHREHLAQARLEAEQAQRAELEAHKAAFVDRLNDSFLFDSMYTEDVEGNKLSYLPGVGELLETYKDKFVTICVNIFEYGLKQQEKRKIELDTFTECIQEAIQENQEQGKLKIAQFEEKHSLSLSNIREASELPTAERIAECDQDITELFNALMTLEMQLAEQLETISMFERNIVDLVGLFIENVQSLYPSCCGPGGTGQPRPAVLGPLLDSRRDDGAVSGPGEPPPREAAGDLHQHPGEDGQGRAGRGPARRRASGSWVPPSDPLSWIPCGICISCKSTGEPVCTCGSEPGLSTSHVVPGTPWQAGEAYKPEDL